jgi:uncharacterized protein
LGEGLGKWHPARKRNWGQHRSRAIVRHFSRFLSCDRGYDDGHGERGGGLALALRGEWFSISDDDFDLLYEACACHTDGRTEAKITIQTCWDADRLDLGRVRICPDPAKLCTPAAKSPEMLKWADGRACFEVVPDFVQEEWGIELGG